MQRRTTRQKNAHRQANMPGRFPLAMLPQEMLGPIYSFLTNEELLNFSIVN